MTKLSRDSTTGKLIVCSNLDGKLLRGGCCPTCEVNLNSVCPAVYKWAIPEFIDVTFTGISLAQQQVTGGCSARWSPSGWSACVYDCQYWCNTIGGGSWGGHFRVPIVPYWGLDYSGNRYFCGGQLILEDAVYFTKQTYYSGACGSILTEGWRDIQIGIGVRRVNCYTEEGTVACYRITCDVTVEGVGKIFTGHSEVDYLMDPPESRHGYTAQFSNDYEDTYNPEPQGPCSSISALYGWGGSVSISDTAEERGLYPFTFWIKEMSQMVQTGNTVGSWVELNYSNMPHSIPLVYEYKVTYGGGLSETFRKCLSPLHGGSQVFLGKTRELGQHLGYTTLEILNIYSPEVTNLSWDKTKGASGFAWGNFDIQDNIVFVESMTCLPEDDNCLPCANDICYTARCEVQLGADPTGLSTEDAIVYFDWRKDDGSWVTGGQAIANASGIATLITTECIGIDYENPAVPFVVEFRVTDVSKAEMLYKPDLNSTSNCLCGPMTPPLDCVTLLPPTPDPPTLAHANPFAVFVAAEGAYYIVVTANEPTSEPPDEDGYEYFFECVDDASLNSGWRNLDTVAGLSYPNGTAQAPNQIWIKEIGGYGSYHDYGFRVKIRDVMCQKETGWSATHSVNNPAL